MYTEKVNTPVGDVFITVNGSKIERLELKRQGRACRPKGFPSPTEKKVLNSAKRQLRAYFQGELKNLNLPVRFVGTPFQKKVWTALIKVPYGQTVTYGELARRLRQPSSARAVGAACGANPVMLVVPCHRVVAANGGLGGFAAGVEVKERLLQLET